MQYILRFFLSVLVIVSHFWTDLLPGGEGALAVMGFYVISGYVITLVMKKTYANIESGFRKFWINRFLRLYPTFIVCVCIGFFATTIYPEQAFEISQSMVRPETAKGAEILSASGISPEFWLLFYIPQLLLIGHQSPLIWSSPVSFAPNAWSVNMELYFYILFSLGVSSTFARTKIFLKAGLYLLAVFFVIMICLEIRLLNFSFLRPFINAYYYTIFYKSILGITVFFGIGAVSFYAKNTVVLNRKWKLPATAMVFIFPAFMLGGKWGIVFNLLLYGAIIALVLIYWCDNKPKGIVKMLGDLSYPLFLVHWPIGVLIAGATGLEKNNMEFLVVAGGASMAASLAILFIVERPIEYLRDRVRR